MNQLVLRETILSEANKCVLCGLCLPECPTFAETRREVQSPRGRIALAKALAENKLPANNALLASLASCLRCRSCEQACPSKVKFRNMLLATDSLLNESAVPMRRSPLVLKLALRLAKVSSLFAVFIFF